MNSINSKINLSKSILDGFSIPHKNLSLFAASSVYAIVYGIFTFFTIAFYEPFEAPDLDSSIRGFLTWPEYLVFFSVLIVTGIFIYAIIIKWSYDSLVIKPDAFELITNVASKVPRLMIASVLLFLATFIASLFFILPGIFISVKFMYYIFFIVIEDKGVIDSFKSSWKIVNGNWFRTVALSIYWFLPISIASFYTIPLSRNSETIISFIIVLLALPWSTTSFMSAFLQIRNSEKN